MKDIVDFLSKNGFDTYKIGTKKIFKVNDEYWNQVYDDLIYKLINKKFDYIY
tara:strand:- start:1641 stop:1796 length:156 start_codon:yes stop_codon:yes gene_type:complete